MKKLMSMILMVVMMVTMFSTTVFAVTESKVGFVLNGKVQTWDEKTYGSLFVKDGRTFIPLRAVSEKLGYKVTWNAKTNSADIEKGETKISFVIGKPEVNTAKGVVTLDVKPFTMNGRTYVPMRGLFEAVGMEVRWLSAKVTASEIKTSITNMKSDFYVVVGGEGSGTTPIIETTYMDNGGGFKAEFWKNILAKNVPEGTETYLDLDLVMVGESYWGNENFAPLSISPSVDNTTIEFVIRGWSKAGVQGTLKSGLQAVAKTTADGNEIFAKYEYARVEVGTASLNKWFKAKDGTQYMITTQGTGEVGQGPGYGVILVKK